MNKSIRFIALGIVLCAVPFFKSYAQETKNLVKLNLLPLATGTFAVEYERSLTDRFTAGGMFSYRSNGGLPLASLWSSSIDEGDLKSALENTRQGATAFAIEGRFYTGKKGAFRGFYLAPYVKYASYSLAVPFPVDFDPPAESGIERIEEVNTTGNLKTLSAGVGLGVQFKIAQNIALDWRILGPGYGSSRGNFTGSADRALTPEEQEQLRDQLEDLDDIPLINIESKTVDTQGVKIKAQGPWAGIRTGLSIGYRF